MIFEMISFYVKKMPRKSMAPYDWSKSNPSKKWNVAWKIFQLHLEFEYQKRCSLLMCFLLLISWQLDKIALFLHDKIIDGVAAFEYSTAESILAGVGGIVLARRSDEVLFAFLVCQTSV